MTARLFNLFVDFFRYEERTVAAWGDYFCWLEPGYCIYLSEVSAASLIGADGR